MPAAVRSLSSWLRALSWRPRPAKIAELEPGIYYVNCYEISDAGFAGLLFKRAEAKGIVFDMRGYPGSLSSPNSITVHYRLWR